MRRWPARPGPFIPITYRRGHGATCLALLDPGDEVVIFEPWYEHYWPDTVLSGAVPRLVTLHEPDWSIDDAELRAACNQRTRAIMVNTSHNPTGKVFTRAELNLIAELAQPWDAYVFTDEITSTTRRFNGFRAPRRTVCAQRALGGSDVHATRHRYAERWAWS